MYNTTPYKDISKWFFNNRGKVVKYKKTGRLCIVVDLLPKVSFSDKFIVLKDVNRRITCSVSDVEVMIS